MKKITIVIVSAISLTFAHAQTKNAPVQFGVKGGVNISTLTGDASNLFSSSVALHAGLQANIPIDKQFSLQPEAVLSIEGTKFSVNGVTGRSSGTYVNVPFLVHYNAGSGVFLQTGPQFGLLMGANRKVTGGVTQNIKDELKSTNFSWAFGVGYMPNASRVGFSARYNLGISNINADASATNHTSVWQVGTFVLLGK